MADVYLSLDSDMRNHLKVRKFCRLMQTKLAIAHLIDLWSAAIRQAPDGDLSKIDPEDVEGMAGYDMGDMRCYRALVDCGFVDESDEDGKPCRRIHNWMKPGRTGYAMKKKTEAVENWRRSMNRGKDMARNNTPPTGSVVDGPDVTDGVTDESPTDDPSVTHGEHTGSAGGENPLHGSRFTSGSLSPSQPSGPDQTPARVSEPDPDDIRLQPGEVTAYGIAKIFGRVRAREWPGAFSWTAPTAAADKAEHIVTAANDDPDVRDVLIPSMVLLFAKAKAGELGPKAGDASFAFGCWVSKFTALREELRGRSRSVAMNGPRKPRELPFA